MFDFGRTVQAVFCLLLHRRGEGAVRTCPWLLLPDLSYRTLHWVWKLRKELEMFSECFGQVWGGEKVCWMWTFLRRSGLGQDPTTSGTFCEYSRVEENTCIHGEAPLKCFSFVHMCTINCFSPLSMTAVFLPFLRGGLFQNQCQNTCFIEIFQ